MLHHEQHQSGPEASLSDLKHEFHFKVYLKFNTIIEAAQVCMRAKKDS